MRRRPRSAAAGSIAAATSSGPTANAPTTGSWPNLALEDRGRRMMTAINVFTLNVIFPHGFYEIIGLNQQNDS